MPISTINTASISGLGYGFKNRIINGDMRIDQRNAGALVTANNVYTVDRWAEVNSAASKYTAQQSSVAPPGFTNSLLLTSTSAYTVTSGDYFFVAQYVEGLNFSDFAWGTANARAATLSFWVRSSLTGTFTVALRSGADDAAYPATYTINAANTWEYKTVSLSGPTSGTFSTGTARSVGVWFSLGAGSSFNGTANTWAGGNALTAAGAVSVVGTNGATFYITGVQLEKGVVATDFDYRPYGTELALCQRYCFVFAPGILSTAYMNGTCWQPNLFYGVFQYPVPMRATPTGTITNPTGLNVLSAGVAYANTAATIGQINNFCSEIIVTTSGTMTTGYGAWLRAASSGTPAGFQFSAEL